jgi:small subunit ribosomal protein S20
MANHKSAIKRHRQSEKRRALNRAGSHRLRTQMKKIMLAISSKNVEEANKLLPRTISQIDKSIQKGVLHKSAAARHKSRLMHKVNALSAPTAMA